MAVNSTFVQRLDTQIDQLLAGWNIYTTVLTVVFFIYLCYPLVFSSEPDIHPFILIRQSTPTQVRQPGESAVYRSIETPHGYPLRTGLNVKDPDAPKWTSGRDGDLRDIWKQALKGDDKDGKRGQIISVVGKAAEEHELNRLTKEINIIGKHLQSRGAHTVAIFLPNSVELVVALFAAAFYGFSPILIPQITPVKQLVEILKNSRSETIIAPAGTVTPGNIAELSSTLKQTIWVVESTSRQMDWTQDSSNKSTALWHEIIESNQEQQSSDLPSTEKDYQPPDIVSVTPLPTSGSYEITTYTQKNLVAATSAQLALPRTHRLSSTDTFLPLLPLSHPLALSLTLATLFNGGTLALTTSTTHNVDYSTTFTSSITPTIVLASSSTIANALKHERAKSAGFLGYCNRYLQRAALTKGKMNDPSTLYPTKAPRLVYIAHDLPSNSSPLTLADLHDWRVLSNSRIIYALTSPEAAGSITQTHMLDYRQERETGCRAHFGAPTGCVEVKVVETSTVKIDDSKAPQGEVVVMGPAVVGGEARLGALARFERDGTLALA